MLLGYLASDALNDLLTLISSHRHVFFGPCHDNGYLVVLERYKHDYASRLTLIETRPAEPGFIDLGFQRVQFPRIFRSDNLPGKSTTIMSPLPAVTAQRSASIPQMQPTTAPFVPQSISPAPSPDSASSSTWATVGKTGSTAKTINIAPKKAPARRFLLVNVYDERVDAELPRSDPGAEKRFTERLKSSGKFCNSFHLIGKCKPRRHWYSCFAVRSVWEDLFPRTSLKLFTCS